MYNKGELVNNRKAFGEALAELGEVNPDVVVFEADIAISTRSDIFGECFPERYFNVGVAEQNEMAIAAGAATCGKIAFVCTYAVFATMRACEQVRTFVAYPNLNVKICPSHGGMTPAPDGVTHQATEDLGILRTIPNMTIIVPADAIMVKKAVFLAAEIEGPVYIRLTRDPLPIVYDNDSEFEVGKANLLREGNDVTLLVTGDLLSEALYAADILESKNIEARVLDIHTIKPIDKKAIMKVANETKAIVTIENHQINCGLGSAVAEVLVENCPIPMERVGLRDTFAESGIYKLLLSKYKMDAASIVKAAEQVVKRKKLITDL